MKQITVSFYDCCLPDYFQGSSKPVLCCPVDGSTTRKDLYNDLLSELADGAIDHEIEQNELDYEAIQQAIKDCIYFHPNRKDNEIVFPDLPILDETTKQFGYDYAYFIVDWDE